MSIDKPHSWIEILEDSIDDLAKDVLYDLVKWELERLVERDPSFDELSQRCRVTLAKIEEFLPRNIQVVEDLKELVEILEQVSSSIGERDVELLIDCTVHLQEFMDIRSNHRGVKNYER